MDSERVEVFHEHFAAEPDIIRGPNGEFVVYYSTYNYSSYPECECKDGSTPPGCKVPDPAMFITMMQYTDKDEEPYREYFSDPEVVFGHRFNDTDLGGIECLCGLSH